MNREEIIQKLKEVKPLLEKEYGILRVGIFGSVARGEAGKGSDIDILIEKERPLPLTKFIRIKLLLEEKLGQRVDLVTSEGLKPEIQKEVEKEVIYV